MKTSPENDFFRDHGHIEFSVRPSKANLGIPIFCQSKWQDIGLFIISKRYTKANLLSNNNNNDLATELFMFNVATPQRINLLYQRLGQVEYK